MKHASSPSDETRLHALADGRAIPAGAGTEPLGTEDEATARDWQLQREQLQALHADLAHTPSPEPLRASVAVGSLVRVPLHGRRVGGWVVDFSHGSIEASCA